ncbi:MAG: DUF4384 domain-containing protein [Desulfobulbaceae bacterium]|nr:DUF4384 domain-containing protein [Desulfobulbaceae bacterium]
MFLGLRKANLLYILLLLRIGCLLSPIVVSSQVFGGFLDTVNFPDTSRRETEPLPSIKPEAVKVRPEIKPELVVIPQELKDEAVSADLFNARFAPLIKRLSPKDRLAVAPFSDQRFGDVTALGDLWRDRIEDVLRDQGARIMARREVGRLLEDADQFLTSELDWEKFAAEVLVTGEYLYQPSRGSKDPGFFHLRIKAIRVRSGEVVDTVTWKQPPEPMWSGLAMQIRRKNNRKTGADPLAKEVLTSSKGPKMSSRLNRDPACYPTGSSVVIEVVTEPGSYIYIFNIAADGTVSLLYPNNRLPEQPLIGSKFLFPPAQLQSEMPLVVGPLPDEDTSREAFKIVVARKPIDFSSMPVAMGKMYFGAEGGEYRQVTNTLSTNQGWSESLLGYMVGLDCR